MNYECNYYDDGSTSNATKSKNDAASHENDGGIS